MNITQSQPPAAGEAAHNLPTSLNLQGRSVHTGDGKNGNWGERTVACACNHDGDNTVLMGEMVRRYNSHAALVEALRDIENTTRAMAGNPHWESLAQDIQAKARAALKSANL
jgi:hypothetical protein